MKAIVVRAFGEPDVMQLEQVPEPTPGPGAVLVRVRAAGVNPVDAYIRSGTYARSPKLPYTPGTDGAGDVVAVGEGVADLAPGARVYLAATDPIGTYGELVVAPRASVWPLADRLSYEQGAAVGVPYATAMRALFDKGQARPGEWLLVHGASGVVGTAVVQMAAALGMRVIGTGGTDAGRAAVGEQGALHVLDHRDEAHFERVRELTGGRGVDLIVEMLANVNLGRDLAILAPRGRVVVVGSRGNVEITPRDLMSRDATVTGMTLFNVPPDELARIHHGLARGFENGTLRPQVGRTSPLAQAPAAHRTVLGADAQGKIVLVPTV